MSRAVATALVTAAGLAACGDPLLTAQDRGDGVFGVHGMAVKPGGGVPSSDYQVAVIYLRAVLNFSALPGVPDQVETEVIPGSIAGSFPAEFRVELTDMPEAYPWEDNVTYSNIATGRTDGVFSTTHAPDRVRIGQLMIGPADEIARLPARIDFAPGESRTLHRTLAAYLPNTTITGYQVIYAEGIGPGDVIYPTYTPAADASTGGMPISNRFTLVDARRYFEATIWQECANTLTGELYDDRAFAACVLTNHERIDCLSRCSVASCEQDCEAAFPDLLDQDGCLAQTAVPKLETSCGPVRSPRPYQVQILNSGASLSVVAVSFNIKPGLRILQSTVR